MKNNPSKIQLRLPPVRNGAARTAIAIATSVLLSNATLAQTATVGDTSGRFAPVVQPLPKVESALVGGAYAVNAGVGQLQMELSAVSASADGVTPIMVTITATDLRGQPLPGSALVTIEANGGRIILPDAHTDEMGPGLLDADKVVPGTQIKLVNGRATFSLIAPPKPQDVKLRLTAGTAEVSGVISFVPDLREMIVAGLVEGIISIDRRKYDSNVVQAGMDDGFEQSLRAWSRSFHNGDGTVAADTAFFLKGKIRGDALLTLAYDSAKPPATSLLSQVKPEEFYPVYGDSSIKSFEATSASKLYVRIDKDHSFLLYGDFTTSAEFSQAAGTGLVGGSKVRQLGAYNRTATGLRGHAENQSGSVNGFVTHDTLQQLVQEWHANGTSGPFAVSNSTGIQNSETISVIVRDKNVLNRVVSETPLTRLIDYVFEPFSGRVLLTRPIASLDPNGNPISLRITYSVDQGGSPFWIAGIDGEANVGSHVVVGGNVVDDRNPLSPFRMESGNFSVKMDEHTTLVAEAARTDAVPSLLNGGTPTLTTETVSGRAARIEIDHKSKDFDARVWVNRTGGEFHNPASSAVVGTQEAGVNLTVKATEKITVDVNVLKTEALLVDASRLSASASVTYKVDATLEVSGGVRRIEEAGVIGSLQTGLAPNPSAGSYFAPGSSGGFAGASGSSLLNVNNGGNSVLNGSAAPSAATDLNATTAFVGVKKKLTDALTVEGLAEVGEAQHRFAVGASYQLAERTRLYGRAESQTGLGSAYSLDPSNRSNAVSLGIDSTYMEGGTVFSEYRLRDAATEADAQIATGVRNVWHVSEGMALTAGAEHLQLLQGQGQEATALTTGLDYKASDLWKGSARLEWRRLGAPVVSGATVPGPGAIPLGEQDSVLMTLAAARKLDRDWTMLGRNYLLMTNNHGIRPNGWQDRFQIGAAYRPVDIASLDVLSKYEYKTENDIGGDGEMRRVQVLSVQGSLHPSRPWWLSGRVAAKSVVERYPVIEGGSSDTYQAGLISARAIYDVTENWDAGLITGVMFSNSSGSARQHVLGGEVGYLLRENLWLSVGYNVSGFRDADLSTDYTARGAYIRLRFKFDKDLFSGSDPTVNRALSR